MLSTDVSGIDCRLLEQRVRQELATVSPRPAPLPVGGAGLPPSAPGGPPLPGAMASMDVVEPPSPPATEGGWASRIVRPIKEFFGRTRRLQLEVSAIWTWAEGMASRVHEAEKQVEQLHRELAALRQEVQEVTSARKGTERAVSRLQGDLHFEHRRLARLAGGVPPSDSTPAVASPTTEIGGRFTLGFEERFRGARQEIKQRLRFYLDYVKKQPTLTARLPLLDIGCGRGEWLDLLREAGITAYGIDTNPQAVDACLTLGLEVRQADAIAHLAKLPDSVLGGISIFHVIEHLPLDLLLQLIDEARRTLVPGGVLLLETPNPENLKVGACTFHYDPTHLRPIPPLLAEYLVASRGFGDVELRRINPYPDSSLIHEDSEAARRLNDLLYGPQDVAVIARKA